VFASIPEKHQGKIIDAVFDSKTKPE